MPAPKHLSPSRRSAGDSSVTPRHRAESPPPPPTGPRHRAAADLPGAGTIIADGPAKHRPS